jgi:chaperone modulatory protein CbpM
MNQTNLIFVQCPVVEETVHLTLVELCQACSAEEDHVVAWVLEGVLEPRGESQKDWLFSGESLRRARLALRLWRDLEINPPGVALVLDLLDEIAALRVRLIRTGVTIVRN